MSEVFKQDSYLVPSGEWRDQPFISVSSQAEDYFAIFPVIDIQIDQRADLSISKTLYGSFNYVVFEDMPVTITITGLYSLSLNCQSPAGIQEKAIQNLYTNYKVGNKDNKKLTVTINGISYDVVAVSLTQQPYRQAEGIMSYRIVMLGSRND